MTWVSEDHKNIEALAVSERVDRSNQEEDVYSYATTLGR